MRAEKDYRVTVKVRNNRIMKSIEAVGGVLGKKWCDANGLTYSIVNSLINMTLGPLSAKGGLNRSAVKLCEVLGKPPEELWSNEQLCPLEKNYSEMEMDYSQVVAMLPQEQQSYLMDLSDFENTQTKVLLDRVVLTLSPMEQELIKLRFEDDLTLKECGDRLGFGIERARKVEAKALRKLRHPSRAGKLVDALDHLSDKQRAEYKALAARYED